MARRFSSKEDLESWLEDLDPVYAEKGYADMLYCSGEVRSTSMLANARCEDLKLLGLNPLHATDIIKRAAGGAGPGPGSRGAVSQIVEAERLYVDIVIDNGSRQLPGSLLLDTGCTLELVLSEHKIKQLGLKHDGALGTVTAAKGAKLKVKRYGAVQVYPMMADDPDGPLQGPSAWLECYGMEDTGAVDALSGMSAYPLPDGLVQPMEGDSAMSRDSSAPANSEPPAFKLKLSPIKRGRDKYSHDAILGFPGMRKLKLGIDKETGYLIRIQTTEQLL